MSTMRGMEKYDGEPKTMIDILKEFVWCDWDLLADIAEKAADADTLINMTEAAIVCNGSLSDTMSDCGYDIIDTLEDNPNLPEAARKLIEAHKEDEEDSDDED